MQSEETEWPSRLTIETFRLPWRWSCARRGASVVVWVVTGDGAVTLSGGPKQSHSTTIFPRRTNNRRRRAAPITRQRQQGRQQLPPKLNSIIYIQTMPPASIMDRAHTLSRQVFWKLGTAVTQGCECRSPGQRVRRHLNKCQLVTINIYAWQQRHATLFLCAENNYRVTWLKERNGYMTPLLSDLKNQVDL